MCRRLWNINYASLFSFHLRISVSIDVQCISAWCPYVVSVHLQVALTTMTSTGITGMAREAMVEGTVAMVVTEGMVDEEEVGVTMATTGFVLENNFTAPIPEKTILQPHSDRENTSCTQTEPMLSRRSSPLSEMGRSHAVRLRCYLTDAVSSLLSSSWEILPRHLVQSGKMTKFVSCTQSKAEQFRACLISLGMTMCL